MKKILLAALLAATPVSAEVTEMPMTVYCDSYKSTVSDLMVDYSERMIWEGQWDKYYTALFVNRDTGTWTIIKYDEDKVAACQITSGIGYDVPD